jgi:LacI family gluconate utilization system Gnt-I transcriptional repressor
LRARGVTPAAAIALPELASVEGGSRGVGELLAQAPRPEALFCSNDVLALGALFECHRRGVRVPQDLAIAGFGDLDASNCATPPLTTVRPPGEEIGRHAAELVLRRAQAPRETVRRVRLDLGFTLIARESTQPANAGTAT